VLALSIVVLGVVVVLNRKLITPPADYPSFVPYQPALHATLNGTCALLLCISLFAIKQKNVALHKKLNLTTFFLSALFLISYVVYHFFMDDTRFPEDNSLRPVYLFILASHIILAAVVFPMILMSFYFGLSNKIEKHKKLARFTFPIWLYVCITGVVVYVMISPYYNF
jgi:putative membrane protein